jgi:RNA polymerase sigma factor (sigma-70 family)
MSDRRGGRLKGDRSSREISDAVLADAIKGDREALDELVVHYKRFIYHVLSRLVGNGDHVNDLAQNVYEAILKGLPRYTARKGVPFSAWVATIVQRKAVDHMRRKAQEKTEVWFPPEEFDLMVTALDLRASRARLTDEERDLFDDRFIHQKTFEQIADERDIGTSTAKERYDRVLDKIVAAHGKRKVNRRRPSMRPPAPS